MKKKEILVEKYITCDVIEKCLMKVQSRHPSVRMQKMNPNQIFWFETTSLGRRVGTLSKNQEGRLEFETI